MSDKVWLFDLDNTLYPADNGLLRQIDSRMRRFVARLLGIDENRAWQLQKEYLHHYGTTLRGMIDVHGVDPHQFLADVHDIDFSGIAVNQRLDQLLGQLPGTKIIYTNASQKHAGNVLQKMEIHHHFSGIFSIEDADFIPKPQLASYHKLLSRFDLQPEQITFFEDTPRNLKPAAEMGMTTVWIRDAEHEEAIADHQDFVHHVSETIIHWLEQHLHLKKEP